MNTFITSALIFASLQSPVNTEDPLPKQGKAEMVLEQKVENPDIKSVLTNLLRNKVASSNDKTAEKEDEKTKEEKDNEKLLADIKSDSEINYEKLNKEWKDSVQKLGPKVYKKYEKYIKQASEEFGVPTNLITAIIITESLGNPDALSKKEARGLMQTRTIIDKDTGIYGDSFDPEVSIRKGTAYLSILKNRYGMENGKMLVAYNEGPTRTKKFGESEIEEHNYFQKVTYVLENVL